MLCSPSSCTSSNVIQKYFSINLITYIFKVVPLDVNIAWLTSSNPKCHVDGWSPELDRLRYSPDSMYIRKFEPARDYCIVCHLSTDDRQPTLTVYGNDAQMAEMYFQNMFLGGHLDVNVQEMGVLTRGWVENPHDMLYFSGTIHSAFGVWGKVLVEKQLGSY
jgi:hypothetical protein